MGFFAQGGQHLIGEAVRDGGLLLAQRVQSSADFLLKSQLPAAVCAKRQMLFQGLYLGCR
jgi:hypothetical protein